ncbi:MAG: hypothetical protein DWP97_03345 [Calditrichaeota bacterium]|nr:MAG: hypothetical protein DWP97_03345 [Calditrichota bacterium]
MFNYKLRNFTPCAKLFVGMTTILMLGVVLWSMLIFYVDKGLIDEGTVPDYMVEEQSDAIDDYVKDAYVDAVDIVNDSLSELAPDWDTNFAEESTEVTDPELLTEIFIESDIEGDGVPLIDEIVDEEAEYDWVMHLRHNVGLAHTHINGQTLLYFVLVLFLVLTGVKPKLKRILTVVFGVTIFTHTIGLTGEGFHWIFDDLLAVSGVGLLVLIPYISFLVLAELFKKPDADLSK